MIEKPENLRVSMVVAMDEGRAIGKDGKIPWHISGDLQRVKKITMGHPLIMGRKTFELIGKPLPGRTSIVLTHRPGYQAEGAVVVNTLEDALAAAAKIDSVAYVFGGSEIYKLAMPVTDEIKMTHVSGTHDADTFFPEFEDQFKESRSEETDEDGHHVRYVDYERIH